MLSRLARLMLTATAIAPVLLTYAWVAQYSGHMCPAVALSATCAVLVLLCLWLIRYARKNLERVIFKATKVEAADHENAAFLLLYLLPLFTSPFDDLQWHVWIPVILIFAIAVATGYGYHFNPLLGLLGWHFYKAETEEGITYLLITKKQLRNAKEEIVIGQLTQYILLDLGDS